MPIASRAMRQISSPTSDATYGNYVREDLRKRRGESASYAMSQRSAEIGLRMAIGATPGHVQWMILRQAGRLGVTGVGLGLALAAAGRTLTAGIMMQDSVGGSSIVAVAAGLMLAIVMIAAWLPARRAARIDPIIALRTD